MKITTLEEIKKCFVGEPRCRAFLIYGDNSFFKRTAYNTILEHSIGSNANEFSLVKFDDKNMNFEEILTSCETAPLMCSHKCIVVIDPPISQMSESNFELLSALIEDVPEYSTLVLYIISDDFDVKKSKVAKIIEKFNRFGCEIALSNKGLKYGAQDFVVRTAKAMGCTIAASEASLVVEKTNGDFEKIYNEMVKLCTYKQGGKITTDDIENLFSLYLSSTVFELTKFIFAGNYEGALKKLNLLKLQKEEPTSVLAELSSGFLDHYRALVGRNAQKNINDLKTDFAYRNNVAFRIENAYKTTARYRDVFFEKCIDLILKADIELKSSNADKYIVLERLITDIFLAKEGTGS